MTSCWSLKDEEATITQEITTKSRKKMSNKEELLAAVVSLPTPQPGQRHRSSGNFSTDNAASGAKRFIFKVINNPNADRISFDVMEDKSGATDPTIWKDEYSGNSVPVERKRDLYIANPKGAGDQDFTVEVYEEL